MVSCLKMLVSPFVVCILEKWIREGLDNHVLNVFCHFFTIGLFIIDPQGVVRQITINDLPVGRNVDEVLRLVEAFQFTDEHGEVCPAGWQKGADTIKPDVKQSKEYFEKAN